MATATETYTAPFYSTLADDADMCELVTLFVDEIPQRISAIEAALAAYDLQSLQRLAHQLKGAAAGYGFPAIGAAAGAVEIAIGINCSDRIVKHTGRLLAMCRLVRNR